MTAYIDFRATYATQPAADKPLEYKPTPKELEHAAEMQTRLMFEAALRSLRERGE